MPQISAKIVDYKIDIFPGIFERETINRVIAIVWLKFKIRKGETSILVYSNFDITNLDIENFAI